jgi:hypothetical protein
MMKRLTPATNSLKKFGELIEGMKGRTDAEATLNSKCHKITVRKVRSLYQVDRLNESGKLVSRKNYAAATFEENYRWYI